MTVGLSPSHAHGLLNVMRGVSYTGITTVTAGLHTGDPGVDGTANASAETTKKTVTWSAPAAGSMALAATVSWTSWSAGTETITHVSLWDGSTFLRSIAAASGKQINDGETLTINTLNLGVEPIAA
jgi:hypothetical protein